MCGVSVLWTFFVSSFPVLVHDGPGVHFGKAFWKVVALKMLNAEFGGEVGNPLVFWVGGNRGKLGFAAHLQSI